MAGGKLIIAKGLFPKDPGGAEVLAAESLKKEIRTGRILAKAFRYREAEVYSESVLYLSKPLFWAVLARVLARGRVCFTDPKGRETILSAGRIVALAAGAARDAAARRGLFRRIARDLAAFSGGDAGPHRLVQGRRPLYLRTDLSDGIVSGGSVGHIGGVLNNLGLFFPDPLFLTSDVIPGVRADLDQILIRPEARYLDFREVPSLAFNYPLMDRLAREPGLASPSFIYQRYSLNNFTGVWLKRRLRVPLVLEFNGSEVWIGRHWGKPLAYEALSARIEKLNLDAADLVVVVSRPLKDSLVEQGVEAGKILVNPNGVDQAKYAPGVDGSAVRARYALEGKLVAGFIGTFGDWHGADVLAEAFGRLWAARPDLRDRLRLLLIGDGARMPQVREAIARHGIGGAVVLTGMVPQKEGPAHLAACDILVSPHVPNPDGSKFFGSPTKLFEYMAMGRGIVASDLDQIGEILSHGRTAWMVRPGDPDALTQGIAALADDAELRARLGAAAREEAVARYTWAEHTRKIIDRLKELCG